MTSAITWMNTLAHYKLSDVPVKLFAGRVEYDVESVISEIKRNRLPSFLGERLREGV